MQYVLLLTDGLELAKCLSLAVGWVFHGGLSDSIYCIKNYLYWARLVANVTGICFFSLAGTELIIYNQSKSIYLSVCVSVH